MTVPDANNDEQQNLIQDYFKVAQEALFSLNSDFQILSFNDYMGKTLNLNLEQIRGSLFTELTADNKEKAFLNRRLKAFADSDKSHFQFTMTWQNANNKTLELAIQLSKHSDQGYIGSAKDLSDTLFILSELYQSKSNFETLFENNLTGILITDTSGQILLANPAAANLMHQSVEDLIGFPFGNIQPMGQGEKFEIDFLRPNMPPGRAEITSIETTWMEQPAHLVIIHDITSLHEAHKRIEEMAYFDSLTSLPNRTFFLLTLNKTIERYKRHGEGFALFFMDLNDFKAVNDSFGHAFGDQLLIQVGKRFQSVFRTEDLLSRMGGDEFTVILENLTNPSDLKNLALKIQKTFKTPFKLGNHEVYSTPSIGIALYPKDGKTSDSLLSQADAAMYVAKKQTTQNFAFYSPEMAMQNKSALLQKTLLNKALINNEFELYYQPQLSLDNHKVESYEALIRWNKPGEGIISPDQFIPQLEQTGLITEVGDWVIDEAIAQLQRWQQKNKPLKKLSVNVSPIQLYNPDFIDSVINRVHKSNVPADRIAIEITESVFITNMINASRAILQLQNAGIEVHMDDFGSGYSSFNELKNLPFDVIKIDQAFIRQIDTDPRDVILVESLINALHGLEKRVIAEGVANEYQKEILQKLQCDIIQGYLLSKPAPIDDLEDDSHYKFVEN